MCENQTIKGRLILFIKHLNIGQGKFESTCGLANGYVNNIRRSITPNKLQQIALQYPILNTGWLMTGEGEMLRDISGAESAQHKSEATVADGENCSEITSRFLKLLEKKDEQIERKDEQIGKKDEQIDRLLTLLEAAGRGC